MDSLCAGPFKLLSFFLPGRDFAYASHYNWSHCHHPTARMAIGRRGRIASHNEGGQPWFPTFTLALYISARHWEIRYDYESVTCFWNSRQMYISYIFTRIVMKPVDFSWGNQSCGWNMFISVGSCIGSSTNIVMSPSDFCYILVTIDRCRLKQFWRHFSCSCRK